MKKLLTTKQIIFIVLVCIISIFAYGKILRTCQIQDSLEKEFSCVGCDGWAFLHFLFFMLLGFVDPNKFVYYSGLGIAWEVFETILGQNNIKVSGNRLMLVGESTPSGTYSDKVYWYGRVTDIAFNSVGYAIGTWLNASMYGTCKVL